jgi:hypothetical protein
VTSGITEGDRDGGGPALELTKWVEGCVKGLGEHLKRGAIPAFRRRGGFEAEGGSACV